jgi:hypothetical protein
MNPKVALGRRDGRSPHPPLVHSERSAGTRVSSPFRAVADFAGSFCAAADGTAFGSVVGGGRSPGGGPP